LDYQMPLAPNQVGEAAVEIARRGRFHGDRVTRVFQPSCEGVRRPWVHDRAMAAFRRSAARPRAVGRGARALIPLLSPLRSRWVDRAAEQSSEKNARATILLGSPYCSASVDPLHRVMRCVLA
jgi:hypothetical protein